MELKLSTPPIKVWYKPLPGQFPTLWPILDIKLSRHSINLPQPILSLVDSGASMSILHIELAKALNFDFKKIGKPKLGGTSVSGGYKSWVLPESVNTNIYGFTFPIKFTVIDNPNLIWPCILGEDTIFQIAKLDFHKFKGFFEMQFRMDLN